MSSYAIDVNWSNYYESDWENVGRNAILSSCEHEQLQNENWCEKCDISEDECEPMMNYAYPLTTSPSDEDILKVVKNTCLTVMEKEGEYYLALCGGGMDLSQQIGLAYILIENWIPEDLIGEISTQKGLSVGGANWKLLRGKIIEQLGMYSRRAKERAKEWKDTKE